jgi:hypothetical protein
MVIEKGKIKEFETPGTLMQNKTSSFYMMAKNDGII